MKQLECRNNRSVKNKNLQRLLPSLLCLVAMLPMQGVFAAVVTSGCLNTSSCTLQELYDGGSLSINDVLFDSWLLNLNEGGAGVDAEQVTVSGIDEVPSPTEANQSSLGLRFTASPALSLEYLEYDFNANASIGGADRSFTNMALELVSFDIQDDAIVEIGTQFDGELVVADQGFLLDAVALANVTSGILDFDIQMEIFESTATVSLSEFEIRFDLYTQAQEPPTAVTEPSLILLVSIGFMGLLMACWRSDQVKMS